MTITDMTKPGERLLQLEQRLETLRHEVLARVAQPAVGPQSIPYRLAEVDSSVLPGDKVVPVRFLDGTFAEVQGAGTPTFTSRQTAARSVAYNLSGESPSAGTRIVCFPWSDRWWFHWSQGGGAPEITASQANAFWSPEWYWRTGVNAGTVRYTGDRICCVPSNDQQEVEMRFLEQTGPDLGMTLNVSTNTLEMRQSGLYSFTIAAEIRAISDENIAGTPTNQWYPSHWNINLAFNVQFGSAAVPPDDPTEKWRRGIRYENPWLSGHMPKVVYASGYRVNYGHPEWVSYGVDVYDYDVWVLSATQTEYINVPSGDFIGPEMWFNVSNVGEGGWGYDENIGFELRRPHLLVTKWE
jgi:hypothetical protein